MCDPIRRYVLKLCQHLEILPRFPPSAELSKSGCFLMRRKFITWHATKSEYGNGSYAIVDDNLLTVMTAFGSKSAQIGGHPVGDFGAHTDRELAHECRDCA